MCGFFSPSCVHRSGNSVKNDKSDILLILQNQQDAWNRGDLEGFMQGYWESDSLKFIGKKGLTCGWKNILDNYRKSYPDKNAMGKLAFEITSVEFPGENSALAIGKWNLYRETDTLKGYFSLVWKKSGEKWVIIADHSS
ncbi:MAG: nuclear transport factor 2 family protein [Bacteroidetes bacterium]|nr:nuclear transport factor 2 family protein [Bacteroidota bacterium]